MIRNSLGIDALFDDVDQERTEANTYLRVRSDARSVDAQVRLNILAATGVVLALAIGMLSSELLMPQDHRSGTSDIQSVCEASLLAASLVLLGLSMAALIVLWQ